MKAFVTGASGFVGGHLLSHLRDCGDDVVAPGIDKLDIRDAESVRQCLAGWNPQVIYHLAGIAFVPDCEDDFDLALNVNVSGTENVLKIARELCPQAKLVIISSGDLYGKVEPSQLPSRETDLPCPANNYSLSKLFAEKLAERASNIYGQATVIMRPFNHIGPNQSERFAISSFAHQLAEMKIKNKEAVIKVGNLSARRDLTDVRDIVKGYRLAADRGRGIYNLCSGDAVSIEDVLQMLIKISGIKVKIEVDESRLRPSEITETRGSNAKAKSELDWRPSISLEQSLKDCFSWHEARLRH